MVLLVHPLRASPSLPGIAPFRYPAQACPSKTPVGTTRNLQHSYFVLVNSRSATPHIAPPLHHHHHLHLLPLHHTRLTSSTPPKHQTNTTHARTHARTQTHRHTRPASGPGLLTDPLAGLLGGVCGIIPMPPLRCYAGRTVIIYREPASLIF